MSAARKSRAGDAFGRLGTAATTNPVPTGDTETPRHHDTTQQASHQGPHPQSDTVVSQTPVRRWTCRIYHQADAESLDLWLMEARRRLGHKVDQARVVRELLRLVADDPELTSRVYERLRHPEQ